jgi:acyl carrier protein
MDSRSEIFDRILDHLPIDARSRHAVTEDATLAQYGVASLHLITLLLELQREFELGGESLADADMPTTVGELVSLIQGTRAKLSASAGSP